VLKQRILTASILAPIVLCGVFLLPLEAFAVFMGVVTLLGAWEWGPLSGLRPPVLRLAYVMVVFLSLVLCWGLFGAGIELYLLLPALLLWCISFVWVLRYPAVGGWSSSVARLAIGVLVLAAAWLSLLKLKSLESGNAWLLLVLLIVWAADIGAYFSGKRWGKVKLAPNVSPGKTREGVYGGLVAVVVTALIFSLWNELTGTAIVYLVLLSIIVGFVSVMGDLFESLLKRFTGIKDSGSILPGHGGVLDRIDSILAAAPFFCLGLYFLPIN